jgi:hypothetical protein
VDAAMVALGIAILAGLFGLCFLLVAWEQRI